MGIIDNTLTQILYNTDPSCYPYGAFPIHRLIPTKESPDGQNAGDEHCSMMGLSRACGGPALSLFMQF